MHINYQRMITGEFTFKGTSRIADEGGMRYRCFSDDILLFIRNPLSSKPSGYAMSESLWGSFRTWGQSEAMMITMMITGSWPTQLDRLVRFRWAKGDFRYLGVILTPISSKLYITNYDKLISQIKNDLERWEMLPLCLVRRVETIRINVLPRL